MTKEENLDIAFIHKHFPETLENIRGYREALNVNNCDDKKYLIECMKICKNAMTRDIDNLL